MKVTAAVLRSPEASFAIEELELGGDSAGLGGRRVEGAKGNIVGALFAGSHGGVAAVLRGGAENDVGADDLAGLFDGHVLGADMGAISTQLDGEFRAVIDDDGDPVGLRHGGDGFGDLARGGRIELSVGVLEADLQAGDVPGLERAFEHGGEFRHIVNARGRDEIKARAFAQGDDIGHGRAL